MRETCQSAVLSSLPNRSTFYPWPSKKACLGLEYSEFLFVCEYCLAYLFIFSRTERLPSPPFQLDLAFSMLSMQLKSQNHLLQPHSLLWRLPLAHSNLLHINLLLSRVILHILQVLSHTMVSRLRLQLYPLASQTLVTPPHLQYSQTWLTHVPLPHQWA